MLLITIPTEITLNQTSVRGKNDRYPLDSYSDTVTINLYVIVRAYQGMNKEGALSPTSFEKNSQRQYSLAIVAIFLATLSIFMISQIGSIQTQTCSSTATAFTR